ncbi:DUF1289 domain-containing protein [Paracoccus sp. KR1-242]|uniref:DUF1289 domain-containing protein n=1 Tax=Paracoccus sp. KR1-242 TaxID=3410028 RepID=UPI003C0B9156
MKPSSPCIDICQIDPATRLCIGCLRSIDEITRWGGMTETERLAIMASLPLRKTGAPPRS